LRAYGQSRHFSNLTLGMAVWDSSYNQLYDLTRRNSDVRGVISCAKRSILFTLAGHELRCYRVPANGIPRGAPAFKKAIRNTQQVYLDPSFAQQVPKGKLLIGLSVDPADGLVGATLSEIAPSIEGKGLVRTPLRRLFEKQTGLPEFPTSTEEPKQSPPKVNIEFNMGMKKKSG